MGNLSLQDFVQTRDESAFLCFGCEKLLADITTLRNKLDEQKVVYL
ncbi:hypothetical protein SPBRAN_1489 [uncultured Candidatus Thioglobus sp.]|nr:hypothetical protein SPBRAN_1489 [uncultured Candidatus Thioglobus sp.]